MCLLVCGFEALDLDDQKILFINSFNLSMKKITDNRLMRNN